MKLTVNGEEHEHCGAGTVAALLEELKAGPEESAVMVNDAIIARGAFGVTQVKPGDRVEILTLMVGG